MADKSPAFHDVIEDHLTPSGIVPITVGHVASYRFIRAAVELIKAGDPTAYGVYVSIKYPSSGATEETRREAYVFALESASELAARFYNRELTKGPGSLS